MDNTGKSRGQDIYLKILDDFPNPIWRCGIDAKCNFFNRNWLDFTGRRLEEELGDGWASGVHPEDIDACIKGFIGSFEMRRPFSLEYRLLHRDGTYHTILDFGNPFYDGERFEGYIGSCYDITDRKKAEEAQKKQYPGARQEARRGGAVERHTPAEGKEDKRAQQGERARHRRA